MKVYRVKVFVLSFKQISPKPPHLLQVCLLVALVPLHVLVRFLRGGEHENHDEGAYKGDGVLGGDGESGEDGLEEREWGRWRLGG